MRRLWSALLLGVALICTVIGGCDLHTVRPTSTSAIPSASSVVSAHPATPAPTTSPSPSLSPSPTVEPVTPSPEPEETAEVDPYYSIYADVGLSRNQYDALFDLVDSSLYMGFFPKASNLKNNDYMNFIFDFLNGNPQYRYGEEWNFKEDDNGYVSISPQIAQKIINSAFPNQHKLRNDTHKNGNVEFKNGVFHVYITDYDSYYPDIYKIVRCSADMYRLYINISSPKGDGDTYVGQAVASVQKDENSLFGFHIVSLAKNKAPRPKVVSVTASSCLRNSRVKTFNPQNVIDHKNKTAWATENGTNEWIQLNFATPQTITGIVLRLGDWTNEASHESSGWPHNVTLEFSDGVAWNVELFYSYMDYPNPFIMFVKEKTTSYIRIIIRDIQYGEWGHGSGPIYISEISPF